MRSVPRWYENRVISQNPKIKNRPQCQENIAPPPAVGPTESPLALVQKFLYSYIKSVSERNFGVSWKQLSASNRQAAWSNDLDRYIEKSTLTCPLKRNHLVSLKPWSLSKDHAIKNIYYK